MKQLFDDNGVRLLLLIGVALLGAPFLGLDFVATKILDHTLWQMVTPDFGTLKLTIGSIISVIVIFISIQLARGDI